MDPNAQKFLMTGAAELSMLAGPSDGDPHRISAAHCPTYLALPTTRSLPLTGLSINSLMLLRFLGSQAPCYHHHLFDTT